MTTFAILILAFISAISLIVATRKPHSFGLGSCQTDGSFVRDTYIFDINDPDSWVCVLNEQPGDQSFRRDAAFKQCGLEWTGLINVVIFVCTALATVILMLLVHRHESSDQGSAELVFTRSDEAWLVYTRSGSVSDLELSTAPPAYEARAEDDLSCMAARV